MLTIQKRKETNILLNPLANKDTLGDIRAHSMADNPVTQSELSTAILMNHL
jgi:hypothetical protein